jgi:hypothetical protein
MTLKDLVFILVFLTSLGFLGGAAVAAIRGRRAVAAQRLRRLFTGLAAYMAVVLLVGIVTPQRTLSLGDPQCSDDWCIAVTGAASTPLAPAQRRVDVEFRLASRARAKTSSTQPSR